MSVVDKLISIEIPKEFVGEVINFEIGLPRTKFDGVVVALIVEVVGYETPIRIGSGIPDEIRLSMVINSPIGKYIIFDAFDVDPFEHLNTIKGEQYLNIPTFKQFV